MTDAPTMHHSLRKSFVRARLLVILLGTGEAHANHLADLAGISSQVLRWAMHGHASKRPRYAVQHGLVTLGLVEVARDEKHVVHRITPRGATLARELLQDRRRWR